MNSRNVSLRRLASLMVLTALVITLSVPARAAISQKEANERMALSIEVLGEIINIPEQGIPKSVLTKCKGLIIIPHMVKGGFIVAANRGHGIIIHRLANGAWSDPTSAPSPAAAWDSRSGGRPPT